MKVSVATSAAGMDTYTPIDFAAAISGSASARAQAAADATRTSSASNARVIEFNALRSTGLAMRAGSVSDLSVRTSGFTFAFMLLFLAVVSLCVSVCVLCFHIGLKHRGRIRVH